MECARPRVSSSSSAQMSSKEGGGGDPSWRVNSFQTLTSSVGLNVRQRCGGLQRFVVRVEL
jgi:hypothetical protein